MTKPIQDKPARARRIAWSCTCFNARRAARAVTEYYDRALKPSGITASQVSMLGGIKMTGPAPIQRLAEVLDLDHTTLTRNLKLLADAGWITARPGEDRRERVVALTSAGEAALARAMPHWQAAQRAVQDRLGAERWRRLLDDLAALAELPAGEEPAPKDDVAGV
jgi:DNA-binding MarR family transcriptional regulator